MWLSVQFPALKKRNLVETRAAKKSVMLSAKSISIIGTDKIQYRQNEQMSERRSDEKVVHFTGQCRGESALRKTYTKTETSR